VSSKNPVLRGLLAEITKSNQVLGWSQTSKNAGWRSCQAWACPRGGTPKKGDPRWAPTADCAIGIPRIVAIVHRLTPDEIYFSAAVNLVSELVERRHLAREQQVATTRSTTCAMCGTRDTATEAVPREAKQIPLNANASVMTWEVLIQSSSVIAAHRAAALHPQSNRYDTG